LYRTMRLYGHSGHVILFAHATAAATRLSFARLLADRVPRADATAVLLAQRQLLPRPGCRRSLSPQPGQSSYARHRLLRPLRFRRGACCTSQEHQSSTDSARPRQVVPGAFRRTTADRARPPDIRPSRSTRSTTRRSISSTRYSTAAILPCVAPGGWAGSKVQTRAPTGVRNGWRFEGGDCATSR
jgi:hypothetical protein